MHFRAEIRTWGAGCEAWMLPLCYASPCVYQCPERVRETVVSKITKYNFIILFCAGRRRRSLGLRRHRVLRAHRVGLVGLRVRPERRARRLRQDFVVHRMDQPDHQRQQLVKIFGEFRTGNDVTLVWRVWPWRHSARCDVLSSFVTFRFVTNCDGFSLNIEQSQTLTFEGLISEAKLHM